MHAPSDLSPPRRRFDPKPLAVGVVLVAVGVLLTLGRLGIEVAGDLWRIWPVGLLVLAVAVAAAGRDADAWRKAAWIGFVGAWLLVNFHHVLGFDFRNSWPFFVIFAGIMGLLPGGRCDRARPRHAARTGRPGGLDGSSESDAAGDRRWRAGAERGSGGLFPLVVGLWLLGNTRHVFGMDWETSWPLLLVLVGAVVLVEGVVEFAFRRRI